MTGPGGTPLARRLSTADAVVIGLGSMIGAGIFAAFTPAAEAAGPWLLVGLALAAGVAWANATSSAQLAAQYPESGGTYVYGRERLGPGWGFAAGWAFIVGKTASCSAMALTAATYAFGSQTAGTRATAIGMVVVLTWVIARGITKTAALARGLLTLTLAALLVGSVAVASATTEWRSAADTAADFAATFDDRGLTGTAYGILQSAGLLFFAFAGYARIATLGEEVRDPQRTIPRAITRALLVVIALYAAFALLLLATLGASTMAHTPIPLLAAAPPDGFGWVSLVVRAGAAIACVGSLLGLLSGVGRTTFAMARAGDLPRRFAAVSPTSAVPVVAQIALAAAVVLLTALTDVRHAIGFSSFGVLLYYAIANAAAWTQDDRHRRWPRSIQVAGLVGCLVLAFTVPPLSVVGGAAVIAAGLVGRHAVGRRAPGG